jgi:predicted kinase
MPNCIIVTGNIGSGKTTLSKKYVDEGYVIISRDQLRYGIGNGKYVFKRNYEQLIHKIEIFMLKEFIKLGVNIFVDTVGVTRYLRKSYIKILRKYPNYKIISIELPRYSIQTCVARRLKNPHGQPDKSLWESVWKKFDIAYETPSKDEGFFTVIRLRKEQI